MANTTNYNWETPDDTDLVKDGAAAIRTLGSSIDTTTKALNPETTLGDIAYRSATSNTNTRLPIGSNGQILGVSAGVPAWINNDQGDITEVQAGVGISIASGTGPIPVITNSSTDLITTAGDLLYGTAADTVARLGIGTAGQVLKVNSGATAPEWGTAASGSTFVGCSLYDTAANLSVANATTTLITWNSEYFDSDAFHSTSSNTGRITIPSGKGGKYLFVWNQLAGNPVASKGYNYRLYKNGSQIRYVETQSGALTTGYQYWTSTWLVDAVATDYFECYVTQSSGGSVNYNFDGLAAGLSNFSCTYLGA
jgi:hypothetical protein